MRNLKFISLVKLSATYKREHQCFKKEKKNKKKKKKERDKVCGD